MGCNESVGDDETVREGETEAKRRGERRKWRRREILNVKR